MGDGCKYSGNAYGKSGHASTECRAVLHGFKTESREEDVKAIVIQIIKATGMREDYTVDFPAIPITHAFVEFQDTRTRDRFVRSDNMRKYERDERRIQISQALELDERFDRKRQGYVKCVLHKEQGLALHWIKMNLQRKIITANGQTVAMIDASGLLRYNKYEDVEVEVQNLMEKRLTKKLVTTTVSSRETRMKRRAETVTTRSPEDEKTEKQQKRKNSHLFQKSGQQEILLYWEQRRQNKQRKSKSSSQK